MNPITRHRSGFGYFFYGLKLAVTPGIRQFVILPLLANVLLVGSPVLPFLTFRYLDRTLYRTITKLSFLANLYTVATISLDHSRHFFLFF